MAGPDNPGNDPYVQKLLKNSAKNEGQRHVVKFMNKGRNSLTEGYRN